MAVGLVTDEEYEKEMSRYVKKTSQPEATVVDKPSRGRASGDVNVPESLRKIIGETSVIDGRQAGLHLAASFGISPSSVSAYAHGATSTTTYDTPSKSILGHLSKARHRAISRAGKTLNSALSAISQEKLDYSDAKDLATIAKDMSVVIKNLEPAASATAPGEAQQSPQFVIFAPQFRREESFEVIDVKE